MNNYVDVEIVHVEENGISIAKIAVSKRSKLSFLKVKDRFPPILSSRKSDD